MNVNSNQRVGFGFSADPQFAVHVSGDLFGRHLLYGGDADSGSAIARSCMKTRDSGGHPAIQFRVYAPRHSWGGFHSPLQSLGLLSTLTAVVIFTN